MTKRYVGTTLTYDVRDEVYLRTEVYMSEDPSETAELEIIEASPKRTYDGNGLNARHDRAHSSPERIEDGEASMKQVPPSASGSTLEGLPFLPDE